MFPFREPSAVAIEGFPGGVKTMRSLLPLPTPRRSLPHLFDEISTAFPDRIFIRQRPASGRPWRDLSYADARRAVYGVAQWLIDRGYGEGDSVGILSPASIEHAIVALGAQCAGMAAAPLSPAYALLSRDHVKLRTCLRNAGARIVFVDDPTTYQAALASLAADRMPVMAARPPRDGRILDFHAIADTAPRGDVTARMAALHHGSIARIMHTSGSTGAPKATPQTQANMVVTVAQSEAVGILDFGGAVVQHLEAMPFHHIMAGNFNFNNVLRVAGAISIDEGKPTPELFAHTIANLREVSPHFFITVPLGYAMLCDAMERDQSLRQSFFRNMQYLGFGGAALPAALQDRLNALARAETGAALPIFSFYGATEYLFGALRHWPSPRADIIGLPLPAVELKMTPYLDAYELAVKTPTMMPRTGYLGAPGAADALFDADGWYRTGDLVRFADDSRPETGIVFSGRIADDFKLSSGTFVLANTLRADALAATAPLAREIVICGDNRAHVGALVWLTPDAARDSDQARQMLEDRLRAFNALQTGSSRTIARAIIMREPLSIDDHELTDKGTASARTVVRRRAADVERLFAVEPDGEVICLVD
jgi:feruloyl-CoA synthase